MLQGMIPEKFSNWRRGYGHMTL